MEKEQALEILTNALDFAIQKGGFSLSGTAEVLAAIETLKTEFKKEEHKIQPVK